MELLSDKLSVALDRVRCMDAEQSTAMARAALSAATCTATVMSGAVGGHAQSGGPATAALQVELLVLQQVMHVTI